MKMIIFNSTDVRTHRVAMSPDGQVVVHELGPNNVQIKTVADNFTANQAFDNVVENMNAELESWK